MGRPPRDDAATTDDNAIEKREHFELTGTACACASARPSLSTTRKRAPTPASCRRRRRGVGRNPQQRTLGARAQEPFQDVVVFRGRRARIVGHVARHTTACARFVLPRPPRPIASSSAVSRT